ncbi:helix-turn-helix domain-containing protein [Halomonadaceae bacterium KBTZ08]
MHDRKSKTWRHLDFFQYEAYIHARIPRVRCSHCGKTTQVALPWTRPGSRFTLLFEALSLTLAKAMPVVSCARQLRITDQSLWRVINHHVHKARQREDYSQVRHIGIDGTAWCRGQHYITLVHDLQQRRLIFAPPGRDSATVERFSQDLKTHQGELKSVLNPHLGSTVQQVDARNEVQLLIKPLRL